MTSPPRLPHAQVPRYLREHWCRQDPAPWVRAVGDGLLDDPVVLPLTRLSGSLIHPVLERAQLSSGSDDSTSLSMVLVSVSPPGRALRELLQLRAYGHAVVLLPAHYRTRFFDLAELDLRGVGVARAEGGEAVSTVLRSTGIPEGLRLEPWWRSAREAQLRDLARV